jgi:uncharacterized delta-60 repeat protein
MREIISFNITNTTNGVVPISILGNNSDEMDNSNESTRYAWDISGFTITNETLVAIQYNNLGISNFVIKSSVFSGTSIQNVIDALNSLIIGSFFTTTESVSNNSIVNTSFNVGNGFNSTTWSIVVQSDGKILYGGDFTSYNAITSNKIIRLNIDGSIDTSFVIGSGFGTGAVFVFAIQTNTKIICGGNFNIYNGTFANRIIRLEANGSVDTSFVSGSGFSGTVNALVNALAIQSDGNILCGGDFANYNGTSANFIIRLNSNGSRDTSFVYGSGFNNIVYSIAIQTNGKIVCGGTFTSYNGTSANRIIRLEANGSVDTSFVYGSGFDSFAIFYVTIQSDGKILCGGGFSDYNGTSANNIIRLNTDGSVDTSFVYGSGFSGGSITMIKIQSDNKIVIGGSFTSYNGTSANGIIRLNSNGSVDTSWVYGSGFNSSVLPIALSSSDNIYVGGVFSTFNTTTSANRIIGLLPSTGFTTSTFINNYNNNIAYGTLQIINPSQSASLSYSFSLNLVGQVAQIYINSVLVVNLATPSNVSGSVSVVAGDVIDFVVENSINPKGTQVFVYNLTTNQYLFNTTQTSSGEVATNFTIVANNSYLLGVNI